MEQRHAGGQSRTRRSHRPVDPAPAERTRGLVSQAAGEAAWLWDPGGDLVTRAGALVEICGFAAEEIPASFAWWQERIHVEDRASVLAAFDAALAGERRELVLLYRFRRKDATYALLLDRAFVLGETSHGPERIVGFTREVGHPRSGADPDSPGTEPPAADLSLERDQLASLSRRLVESVEDERRRISRELHDEIGQLLTTLRILLHSGIPRPGQTEEILDELFGRVRDIAAGLRPPMLDDLGLAPALSWLCRGFSLRTGVKVDLEMSGLERRYAPDVELSVFRVVQESLTNVARHSRVTEVRVTVRGWEAEVECLVLDRGVGFDAHAALQGHGLIGMRERAAAVGGQLQVVSTPGRGTRVSMSIPNRGGASPPQR